MSYDGPERRQDRAEFAAMLARIDERTKGMADKMDTLATKERVDAVETKAEAAKTAVKEHVDNHQAMSVNRNMIVGSYITGFASLGAALIAIFKH